MAAHPVVAVGREVDAVIPVLVAVCCSEGVVGYRGMEVEDVA